MAKSESMDLTSPDKDSTRNVPEADDAMLRRHVRSCLSRLKKGDMFVNGFEDGDFDKLLDGDGNPPPMENKGHVFNKLLSQVAATIASKGEGKGKKKYKKMLVRQLQSRRDEWVEEIQNYDDSNMVENDDAMDIENGTASPQKRQSGDDLGAEQVAAPPKEKKKKKKKGRPPGSKNKKNVSSDDIADNEDPDAMQVDEPPNDDKVEKPKKKGRRKSDTGSKKKQKTQDKDEGLAKEKVVVSPKPSKRQKVMRERFDAEKERILSDLPEDLLSQFRQVGFARWKKNILPVLFLSPYNVPPGDVRNQWMTMYENTKTRQHMMTRLVYWYGSSTENPEYSFVPKKNCFSYEQGIKLGHDRIPNSVKKKLDNDKKLTKSEESHLRGLDEIREDAQKDPADRKLAPGHFLEEYEEAQDDEESVVYDQIDVDTPEKQAPGDNDGFTPMEEEPRVKRGNVDDENIGEDDITSEEEDSAAEIPSDEDEEDLDYEPAAKKQTKKRKSVGRPPKQDKPPQKKAKIDRKRTKKKPTKAVGKQYSKKKRTASVDEQRKFEECESNYLPLEQQWKSSLKADDVDTLGGVMDELSEFVETLSASFIEAYKLPHLMKKTKPLLKGSDSHFGKYKRVWNTLKRIYSEGKDKIPPGFVPVKRKAKVEAARITANESPSKSVEQKADEPAETVPVRTGDAKEEKRQAEPMDDEAEGTPVDSIGRIPRSKEESAVTIDTPSLSRESTQSGMGSPSQSASRVAQKAERKAFSLSHLIRPKDLQGGSSANRKDRTTVGDKDNTEAGGPPSWLTTLPQTDNSITVNEDRTFALEFLEAAATQFPSESVNVEAVARSIEDAVFKWTQERDARNWVDAYWEKVHALAAAICGKQNTGSIVKHILHGKYPAARDLVLASDDVLKRSFAE